jgi:hypothetical protein
MQQVYVVKARKKIFITIDMTIITRRVNDEDGMMMWLQVMMGTVQPTRRI